MTTPPFSESSLRSGGQRFTQSAMDAYAAQNWQVFALHAGTSIELLSKAALVRRSPALLVELGRNDISSLLHLCGVKSTTRPRSIGLHEALRRVARVGIELGVRDADLDLLIYMRNDATHAAGGSSVTPELLGAFGTVVDAILNDLGWDRVAFWGPYIQMIDTALLNAADKITKQVHLKLHAARATFERKLSSFPRQVQDEVREILSATAVIPPREPSDEEEVTCPACGLTATAWGRHEPHFEYEQIDEEEFQLVESWLDFHIGGLRCPACELELDGSPETQAAGFDLVLESKRDPAHYVDDGWEPDEDWFRKR